MFSPPANDGLRGPLRANARSILLGIIVFTLPFYCLGFVIWGISPRGGEGQRIQSANTTGTPQQPSATTGTTPIVFTATPLPTALPTRRPPSATPFPIPQAPPTTRPFVPPMAPPATATDYPLPSATATHTRVPLLPPTNTPIP